MNLKAIKRLVIASQVVVVLIGLSLMLFGDVKIVDLLSQANFSNVLKYFLLIEAGAILWAVMMYFQSENDEDLSNPNHGKLYVLRANSASYYFLMAVILISVCANGFLDAQIQFSKFVSVAIVSTIIFRNIALMYNRKQGQN